MIIASTLIRGGAVSQGAQGKRIKIFTRFNKGHRVS